MRWESIHMHNSPIKTVLSATWETLTEHTKVTLRWFHVDEPAPDNVTLEMREELLRIVRSMLEPE